MCGIAGFFSISAPKSTEEGRSTLLRMAAAIRTRGPDDQGAWFDPATGIGLGHRRLSILDLSPEGHQPKDSACGRYVIAFNGEIYNFREIRQTLEEKGHRFKGTSDTEVLLTACTEWGLEASLPRLNGMFAIALWDRKEQVLHLVRDRVGKKPVYYTLQNGTLAFGSELKALRPYPGLRFTIDRDSLRSYLHYGYVPAPHTIFAEVRQLPAGARVTFPTSALRSATLPEPVHYWRMDQALSRGLASPFQGTEAEAIAELDVLLRDAVKIRMESDVPLGAFLSGGIDSSIVVSMMQAQADRPVRTFTIGYGEKSHDESGFALEVARHLGTDHTELRAGPDDALKLVPRLPELYDEPFSDASMVPTFLVCQLARNHVTVTLSGDGGDEFFGGYPGHRWAVQIQKWRDRIPGPLRASAALALRAGGSNALAPLLESMGRPQLQGLMNKLADFAAQGDARRLHHTITSQWGIPSGIVLGASKPEGHPRGIALPAGAERLSLAEKLMYFDAVSYLTDDILVKVDRASMGVSMEARAPLLDYRVIEKAWTLPLSMKVRDDKGKRILRELLCKYVPRELIDRPKMGFGPPIAGWLQGSLRDWAETLLSEQRLRAEGYFDPALVRRKWELYRGGATNYQSLIWGILMFEAWKEHHQL